MVVMDRKKAKAEYNKKYREQNRERLNEYRRKWSKENPEKVEEYQKRHWAKK